MKRALNVLRLVLELESKRAWRASATERMESLEDERAYLGKLVVLQTSYDDVYGKVVERPSFLREIEDAARGRARGGSTTDHFARDNGERLKAMFALKPFFENKETDEELQALVYLTEATG